MGKRLRKSEDNQQELVQAISHDIKTPLTSLIGYSKRLAVGKADGEKQKEYYDTIFRKANDIKNIIEELEDFGNISQESKYNKIQVNCKNYINSLAEEILREVDIRGSYADYTNDIDDNLVMNVDVNKVKRVFFNIIENSLLWKRSLISSLCIFPNHTNRI
jgi:K+-sensing histidine kinase KdpD